jgi:hypothetical protein
MAGTLLSTGVWCFLVRLPMIHLALGPSRIVVVLSGYVFAAGVLTLPASCILYREHNVTGGRRTLLPVRSFTLVTNRCDYTLMQLNDILYFKGRDALSQSFQNKIAILYVLNVYQLKLFS